MMKQRMPGKKTSTEMPQLRVRTNLIAGQSVENCMDNLEYWRNTLESKCAKKAAE